MALWWCANIFCRLAAAWFPLLFSSLLWQTISPIHAIPSCPQSCSCPGVKEVHCTFRHLTTIPKIFPKDTERLNLGYNSLTEVEGSEFRSLRQLEMLMLHGNDISTVNPGAFYSLRSLQILKLSYNKLTSVNPGLFEGLVSLIRLHLDHNLLDFIEPYSFSGLTSLKLLQLEGNLLKEIHPHTFITVSLLGSFWTSGLKHLHLSDNLLEQLPAAALKTAPRLELLSLHGNPWTCDCQLHWLVEWSSTRDGVIKCKKERGSSETCPQCSSPQTLNGTLWLGLTPDKLTCERPALQSALKQWDNPVWAESEAEPDLPYTRDFEKPLGHLTVVLSDSHGNSAHVACDVRHPGDSSPMTWTVNPRSPGELTVNVSLVTVLECEIDRETLQNLWQLVAYYYESPAILERGQQRGNASGVTYQYVQAINENSPYFTELKGYLVAEPSWLLQPRVTLRLNRQQTTTKKLVMDFTTVITKHINSHRGPEDENDLAVSWALIRRGTAGRVKTALEGSKVILECNVVSSDPEVKLEWMLPDLSIVEDATDRTEISERGELVILNATQSDSGLYHCMVRIKAGVDFMPLRLTIKGLSLSPTAFNGQKIVVEKGHSFSLPCDVTSVLPSQTMWYLPKNQILLPTQQTRRTEMMKNGTLVVRRLTPEDAGEYTCLTSNLYGVDMLSHMVEVTAEKAPDRSKLQTAKKQQNLLVGVEEGEGSGGNYQEIIRPFATQFPKKVGTQQRNPNGFSKRIRIKDSKRKPNKSVKELDPNRWAEILAKANAKPSVALPTEQSLPEPSTEAVQTIAFKPTTTTATTLNNLPPTTTPPVIRKETTNVPIITKAKTEAYSTEKKGDNSETPESLPEVLLPPPPRNTEPTPNRVGGTAGKAEAVTDPPAVGTPQLVDQSENKHSGEGRRNHNIVPGKSNRRRPPYRRRKPPMVRVRPHGHPFYHSSNKPQTTVPPTTTTTPKTSTTTTTTTTTMTTTPVPTTVQNYETSSAEYQTEEDEGAYYEEYNYKDGGSSDTKEDLNSKTPHTTHDLDSSRTTLPSDREKDVGSSPPNPKMIVTPKLDSTRHPTERIVEENLKESESQRVDIRTQTEENGRENKDLAGETEREVITAMEGQGKHKLDSESSEKDADKSVKEWVSQGYNTQDNIQLTTQNRPRPNTRTSPEQNTPTQVRTSSSKVITSHSTRDRTREEVTPKEDKEVNKPKAKPEIHMFPIIEPVHPWLHQNKQGGRQTTTSRTTHTNQDRNTGRQGEINPGRHSQPPRIPPTSRWPSHHHHYPLYPSWSGQRPFSHPRQGPGSHPVSTHRPWPLPHPWAQIPVVTNRPEITAETVKPTTTVSGTTENSRVTLPNPHLSHHHQQQNHHVDGRTQTRDQLFLSRLRNRYRQAQLDRIAQLGRMVTPKPRTSYHNPPSPITPKPNPQSPHRPYNSKPPPPTGSYTYNLQPLNPAKPSSSSFSGFIPTPRPYHPTTPGVLYGGWWPVGAGRISSRRPTAAPPFPWVFGAGSGGLKPHINTVTTASVSVLAESDVFLPCKVTGNPEPSIAWTKVSTGATIPANTKHGPRFEVFKNGTFVIKNIQLQDRGQYLCTAQNSFGSDRMVITLAVQTEAPKIRPPTSTEIAVYLGKNAILDCLASGKPPAQISWILPDRTFVRDIGSVHTPLSRMSLLQNGTLQIHSLNFSSKGDYKCIASNAAGADTITYHLHVAALPPSIREDAMDTVIIQPGRSVYVHCSVKGEPVPALKWTLPAGVHVKPTQYLGRRLFVFPNGTLYMKNVSPADAGSYECLATNPVGIAKRTVQLEVRADPPSFSHQPPPLPIPPTQRHGVPSQQHSVSAMYSSAVYLHCPESTGSTRGTIWQLPSKTIMEHRYSPERPIKVFRNGTLRILQLTELDGGNYLCVFQRPNGEDMELFQVEVLMTPPRIEHVRTAQTRVTFGQNFQVDCVATGLPDPEVTWSLPDGTLINNALQSDDSGLRNRRYVIFGNGTLLLQQMGKRDEGDYTCYAKNKLGKDERKVSVKVGPNAPKIMSKSQSLVTIKLGESAKLSCQATGEPTPKIMWISPRNDVISMSSDKFQIMDDGMLVVKKVILADEGKYACVARNSAGDDVKNMKLEAEVQEPFINSMKGRSTTKVLAVSYQTAHLDCRAEGKPEPRLSWVTPYGHSLPTPYLGGRFQVHRNGSLELRGVRKADEGRYICLAKNNLGEASLLVELDVVSIAEKPSFAVPNIEILPIKQDTGAFMLECPARGKPNPEFAWVLPNGTMLTPGVRLQRFTHHPGNGTLQISQPVASDKGVYRCLAKNVAGQAEKRYALEAGRKPVIRGTTGGMKITYGLNLNLPCTVDGWPQASITWTLPNGLVLDKPQTIGRVTFLANSTLQLRHVATFDRGTYICKAFNSFGSSTLSYPVSVMVFPPRVTNTLTSITRVNRGSPVKLNCVATGIPKPDISWTLPGRTTLVPHNRFTVQGGIHMTEEGSLVIQNPMLMNSGIYKCNAKNALGTDFKSTYLQVV
ncbi:matrix-remodeling-associated protein 5 [Cottoperca gobio]|uniref:Matrix-remodeling-associated protein 5 n=1 Tax=Cottoperca gobio TaxID=56716 RepID=A0A6J2QJU1_COTGO|nr:matrix-remodeling-associated protein 5-like [Cottoperca gobio]